MRRILFFLSFYISFFSLSAQQADRLLSGFVKNINYFSRVNPQEKVWLHFDNTGYYIGETIWFKAYVVGAAYHDTTFLSRVLHVELLTQEGMIVDSRKLKIQNGQCHGEFRLKGNYRSGFYEIRAYTRSMLNFDAGCIFSRVFPVYSSPEVPGDYSDRRFDDSDVLKNLRQTSEKADRINLSFYPEGGDAVLGMPCRIAFKATGSRGEDLEITGTVYNERKEIVTTFATFHQGMGYFELTPEFSEYKVVAECGSRKRTFSLNGIRPSGYVLHANHLNDTMVLVQIARSPSLSVDTVGFSVSCRGIVYQAEMFLSGNTPVVFPLLKSAFPAGCLQLTLFDKLGNILAERLVFNSCNVDYLSVHIMGEKPVYRPLEPITLELQVCDKWGKPVSAGFSLAVRDGLTEIPTGYQGNILTDMLLSSEVKGYIENPVQYFVNNDRRTIQKLDVLMLVQGWRRYSWQLMAGVQPFKVKHYAEEGLDISGKVLNIKKDVPESGIHVIYWMNKDKQPFYDRCEADEQGHFYFLLPDSMNITGKFLINLSANKKGKLKPCRILLDRSDLPARTYSYSDFLIKDQMATDENEPDSLNKRSLNEMQYLDEVTIKKEGLKPDIVLEVVKDINDLKDRGESYPSTVGEYLKSRLKYMGDAPKYLYANQKTYFCYYYTDIKTLDKIGSLVLLEIEKVRSIDIYYKNKFAWNLIAVGRCLLRAPVEPAVFFSVHVYEGALLNEQQPGTRRTYYNGYSRCREFYHQDNSKKLPGEADFRRTLYWNPDVKTDSCGKVKIDFYNNNNSKKKNISVGGIKDQGVFIISEETICGAS